MKNSITKKIKSLNFFKLLKKVVRHYGFPLAYEELTIYMGNNNETVKIVVQSNFGIDVICRDKDKKFLSSFSLDSKELKNILHLLSKNFGNKGWISISSVFEFKNFSSNQIIKFIKNSLMGPLITFINKENKIDFDNFFGEVLSEVNEKNKSDISQENIIDFAISKSGILNTKILSYMERNGIFFAQNKKTTYRELLKSKSNDYQIYEELFHAITDYKLIEKRSFPVKEIVNINKTKVSIIIPCYNSEKTILNVLKSIKYQKSSLLFSNLEVILIDDASNKKVVDLIDVSKFPFSIQVIRLNSNSGSSVTRHMGATYAQGDILIFIDSDILLPQNYLQEHLLRNITIPNAVFVSFKKNIKDSDEIIKDTSNLEVPDYSKDLRIHKTVKKNAVGSYSVQQEKQIEILESTNYFKSFSGSRVFGVYDLSCMVIGHNFSIRKSTLLNAIPFDREFTGWGMEDVYLGLKLICKGNFVIPILSTGVYHIDHPPRSGSEEKKQKEYKKNTEKINSFLDSEITSI